MPALCRYLHKLLKESSIYENRFLENFLYSSGILFSKQYHPKNLIVSSILSLKFVEWSLKMECFTLRNFAWNIIQAVSSVQLVTPYHDLSLIHTHILLLSLFQCWKINFRRFHFLETEFLLCSKIMFKQLVFQAGSFCIEASSLTDH